MKTSRQLVVEALYHMEKKDAWSGIVLDSSLKRSSLSMQDKAFASALFYGTIARRYTLDICISKHSKTAISKMDAIVKNILRIGFYQLLYMNSVPDHAAVDESVDLCRKLRKNSATGFVNAILRSFLRSDKKIPSPEKSGEIYQLALEYSCPPELVKALLEIYSRDDVKTMLGASLMSPPAFIRVNSTKISTEKLAEVLLESGMETREIKDVAGCLEVTSGGAPQNLPEYNDGLFYIQDISSQRVAKALGAKPGERILDCCAAPGGKTFLLSETVGSTGEIVACDIYKRRVEEIERRQKLLGLTNIKTMVLDMTEHHSELGEFDRVVCDVPCSGYGTIRRSPEIKYKSLGSFKELPQLQLKLLSSASKYCKKGGLLIYSTCTLLSEENEKVVEKFLENHSDFTIEDSTSTLGKTILLGEMGGDGFFYGALRHKG